MIRGVGNIKVSRTIGDLACDDQIAVNHLVEVIHNRSLDRQVWLG